MIYHMIFFFRMEGAGILSPTILQNSIVSTLILELQLVLLNLCSSKNVCFRPLVKNILFFVLLETVERTHYQACSSR